LLWGSDAFSAKKTELAITVAYANATVPKVNMGQNLVIPCGNMRQFEKR